MAEESGDQESQASPRYAYGVRPAVATLAAEDGFYSRPWQHLENHVGTDTKRRLRKRVSFRETVKRIQAGMKISTKIVGQMKGRLLHEADLPPALEQEVATQLGWGRQLQHQQEQQQEDQQEQVPAASSASATATFRPELAPTAAASESASAAQLQRAFRNFTFRMEVVSDEELATLTTGLMTGLRSWLGFGTSMAPSLHPTGGAALENRMATLLASTQFAVDFHSGAAGGGGVSVGVSRSRPRGRRRATPTRADDKLTKRAEEQATKIAGDFCAWLRQLPEGEWNTLNELPEEHVRALFATGQCATNPARSKLAEGLKSWAAFGLQVSGGKAEEIAAIARQQVNTSRFKRLVEGGRRRRRQQQRQQPHQQQQQLQQQQRQQEDKGSALVKPASRALRRQLYSAETWYRKPESWNAAFRRRVSSADGAAVRSEQAMLNRPRRSSTLERAAPLRDAGAEADIFERRASHESDRQSSEESRRLATLESSRAFAAFLRGRTHYVVPDFLRDVLINE